MLRKLLVLCLFSLNVNATEVEEVVVTAQEIKIVLVKLSETHKQNPITGDWHYVDNTVKTSTGSQRG